MSDYQHQLEASTSTHLLPTNHEALPSAAGGAGVRSRILAHIRLLRGDEEEGEGGGNGEEEEEVQLKISDKDVDGYKEQDRFLPIANVGRVMKRVLPRSTKVSKQSKETVQECTSEFISFITSEAAERCTAEKRKTINGEDVLFAMNSLGFENYAEVMKIYLSKWRGMNAKEGKRMGRKRASTMEVGGNEEGGGGGRGRGKKAKTDDDDESGSTPRSEGGEGSRAQGDFDDEEDDDERDGEEEEDDEED